MENADNSEDRLFEELSLNRIARPAESPQWGGYGGSNAIYRSWTNTVFGVDIVYLNDKDELHRIYGPALISKRFNLYKWYKDGKLHRVGGPALQHKDTFHWYYEDKLHNLEGPAVIDPAGPFQYWIHGQRMSEKEYKKEIARRKRKGLLK
jgi:hypothetical protein